MNYATYLEQFDDYYDAAFWIEELRTQHPDYENWEVVELRINFLGEKYRAGVSFRRIDQQLEFDFDNDLEYPEPTEIF